MSEEQIYEKLNEIFRDVFMDESIVVKAETCAKDIEDWESLMQMVLLNQIEKKFNMKFQAKEAMEMQNVGEMVEIIKRSI